MILLFAPDRALHDWIESELGGSTMLARKAVETIADIVARLVDDPPPRPQMLIADFDAIDAAEALRLHGVRERGWFGTIIALGDVSQALQTSLNIECVVPRPFASQSLAKTVAKVGLGKRTTKMPKI